jgi:hypothetical protein
MMVTITAKTASEYVASRSAVSFSSRMARSLGDWSNDGTFKPAGEEESYP